MLDSFYKCHKTSFQHTSYAVLGEGRKEDLNPRGNGV